MQKFDIKLKSINMTIYLKDGEEISKFLAFIGASKSVLKFEEIRVQRNMNNKILTVQEWIDIENIFDNVSYNSCSWYYSFHSLRANPFEFCT